MPMTCHNRRPQNTTVSEVMGSGFFGGSVGKSCEVKEKQWGIEWILSSQNTHYHAVKRHARQGTILLSYKLQWCLVNVTLSIIYVNMAIKRKRNCIEYFITQNFTEKHVGIFVWTLILLSCASLLTWGNHDFSTRKWCWNCWIVDLMKPYVNMNYWTIPSSADRIQSTSAYNHLNRSFQCFESTLHTFFLLCIICCFYKPLP